MASFPTSPDPSSNLRQDPKPPDPTSSYTEKVSFAAKLSQPKLRPRFDPIPLPHRQYGQLEGKPRIAFTSAEVDAGARAFQFSLIAKFTVGRPSIGIIRQAFQANWDIKGRATLSEIWDARHLLIILDSEEDMVAALASPLRKVQHAMFRLFRYSSDYDHKHESKVAVKWLRLPGLPPPLFHRNYIGAIVNSFADFLDIDDRTKACASMRFARACAEIDVTHPIPIKVWIDIPDGKGFWQDIVVEGNTSYCAHCRLHGHDVSTCRKKKPSNAVAIPGQAVENRGRNAGGDRVTTNPHPQVPNGGSDRGGVMQSKQNSRTSVPDQVVDDSQWQRVVNRKSKSKAVHEVAVRDKERDETVDAVADSSRPEFVSPSNRANHVDPVGDGHQNDAVAVIEAGEAGVVDVVIPAVCDAGLKNKSFLKVPNDLSGKELRLKLATKAAEIQDVGEMFVAVVDDVDSDRAVSLNDEFADHLDDGDNHGSKHYHMDEPQ